MVSCAASMAGVSMAGVSMAVHESQQVWSALLAPQYCAEASQPQSLHLGRAFPGLLCLHTYASAALMTCQYCVDVNMSLELYLNRITSLAATPADESRSNL